MGNYVVSAPLRQEIILFNKLTKGATLLVPERYRGGFVENWCAKWRYHMYWYQRSRRCCNLHQETKMRKYALYLHGYIITFIVDFVERNNNVKVNWTLDFWPQQTMVGSRLSIYALKICMTDLFYQFNKCVSPIGKKHPFCNANEGATLPPLFQ